jgi:hypothetical protein
VTPELIVIGVVAGLVAAYGFTYGLSPRRLWNPLRMGMALTTLCLLYFGAAVLGYTVPAHDLLSLREYLVWRQAVFGGALGVLSIPLWWLGVK